MGEVYHVCKRLINCRVRVHTSDGQCYIGTIVNVDDNNVYLQTAGGAHTSGKARTSAWFGARNNILTLSLFTLLAIALI